MSRPEAEVDETVRKFVNGRICEICAEKRMSISDADLNDDLNLYESGVLDSFDLYQFLLSLEEGLDVELDISELDPEEFTNYGKLTRILVKSLSKAPG